MKNVTFTAQVDTEKCKGCDVCAHLCPTAAIAVVDKKAEVNEGRCIFCARCLVECPDGSMLVAPRAELLLVGVDPSQEDQAALGELCARAHLDPEEYVCVCTGVQANEVACAILNGARTPEEVSLMTGTRAGCDMWCNAPIQRLLQAHGIDLVPPDGHRWYRIDTALWNIPQEVRDKYPEYFLEEDKQLFDQGVFDNLATVFLKGGKTEC